MQDLVAAAAALEKLRKEAEAAKQLAEKSAAAHTYGVDRAADRKNAALVVTRLSQLQNVRIRVHSSRFIKTGVAILITKSSACRECIVALRTPQLRHAE